MLIFEIQDILHATVKVMDMKILHFLICDANRKSSLLSFITIFHFLFSMMLMLNSLGKRTIPAGSKSKSHIHKRTKNAVILDRPPFGMKQGNKNFSFIFKG